MEQKQTDVVIKTLIEKQTTISTMESCTSGLIASMITDTEMLSHLSRRLCDLLNETKMLVGVDEQVLRQYGVYSRECAQAMAKTVQEKLHTDISIGVTGTTGNIDPNNADSVQGKMFFCIRIQNMPYTYEVNTEVTGRSRHEIKQFYADQIFEKLSDLIKNV